MRIGTTVRTWLRATAVSLYALVVLMVLPMHLLERAPDPAEGRPGADITVACHDRGCHVPSHHHAPGSHTHDPATCVTCAQAAILASAVPLAPVVLPTDASLRPAAAAAADEVRSLLRASPTARGPPVLS